MEFEVVRTETYVKVVFGCGHDQTMIKTFADRITEHALMYCPGCKMEKKHEDTKRGLDQYNRWVKSLDNEGQYLENLRTIQVQDFYEERYRGN